MPERYGLSRNQQIRDNVERMQREWESEADSLTVVQLFNARLTTKKAELFWPTIAAALASKHYWLIIACDSCDSFIDLDLTVKRRDPKASIQLALDDVRCPRCNGHGRTRIARLSRYASI